MAQRLRLSLLVLLFAFPLAAAEIVFTNAFAFNGTQPGGAGASVLTVTCAGGRRAVPGSGAVTSSTVFMGQNPAGFPKWLISQTAVGTTGATLSLTSAQGGQNAHIDLATLVCYEVVPANASVTFQSVPALNGSQPGGASPSTLGVTCPAGRQAVPGSAAASSYTLYATFPSFPKALLSQSANGTTGATVSLSGAQGGGNAHLDVATLVCYAF
jgi:hypothetical protein